VKTSREVAVAKLREWRYEPDGAIRFVRERFKAEPDPGQIEALISYQKNPRTAMKASKGTGKTTTLSWMGWHFLTVWDDCNIAATSITSDNLRDGLWKEMAVWQNQDALLQRSFKWTKERIFSKHPRHEATWWMSFRTWSKSANAQEQSNTLAGLHAKRIMFLLDETGGMPRPIMATAEGALASGEVCKIAQGGNPTNLEGPLYDACTTERALWGLIEMTGDPDNQKRSPRVNIQWARDQIKKYGRNSPWVKVNVFGEFPEASLNTLLGPNDVTEAMGRHVRRDQYEWAQKRLGIDVARFGDDLTVIFPRQGLVAFIPAAMSHPRNSPVSVDIAARVLRAKQRWGSELECFDATGGWAAGARDILVAGGHSPISIIYNTPAIDQRYANRRAEMWLEGSEWVKNGGALPNVPELVGELTIPQYTYVNGKFQLEPKEHIKERLGRSPNYADALFNTFCLPDMPASNSLLAQLSGYNQNHAKTDYDPYSDDSERTAEALRAAQDFDPMRETI
jgi:phage terminase large subunit